MPDLDGQFWLLLRAPHRVPVRRGPFRAAELVPTLREVMAARPEAYIIVVTIGENGPEFQDGPEALMQADARCRKRAKRHITASEVAHDLWRNRTPPTIEPFLLADEGGGP